MFDLQRFLEGLDLLYASGKGREAEDYLKRGLKEAAACGDDGSILAILNELMGYYRAAGRHEECLLCARQAMELADELGLDGTMQYGTMLLNAATGYRAAGRYQEAERLYGQAYEIYRRYISGPDYHMASLHNNLSLLYSETGRLQDAKRELEEAMSIIQKLDDADSEIAITHTNLGNLCFQMNQTAEGKAHMEEAVRMFEKAPDGKDSHYASALSGLGEAYFREGNLEASKACYEKALQEIEAFYGENEYYQVTKRNLELVADMQKRQEAAKKSRVKGLELARAYYETYGKPMIEEKFPEYRDRIAAGLVGEGSECLGYDDALSTDHDFGPGFCLWLTKKDYRKIGSRLQEAYDALPKEFMGYEARNATSQAGRRVGVFEIGEFFRGLTGFKKPPKEEEEWLSISQERLRTAVSGAVFEDPLGKMTRRWNGFAQEPESARLKRLYRSLGRMAQAGQYNFGRAKKRNDMGAMYFSLSEFLNAAVETAYLLNETYMPFYKWKLRGMEEFQRLPQMRVCLEELMEKEPTDKDVEERIERICCDVAQELREQGLSESTETFLEAQKSEILKHLLKMQQIKGKESDEERTVD